MTGGGGGGAKGGAGPWTEAEHSQFERGLVRHGWGNWKALQRVVPSRTAVQVKSHAQKFRKHHGAECDRLEGLHEALSKHGSKRRAGSAGAEKSGEARKAAAKSSGAATAAPKRRKSAAGRRRGGLSKSATAPARASLRSPRPNRRYSSSFTGPVKSPPPARRGPPAAPSAPRAAAGSPPGDGLMEVTSAVGRVLLGRGGPSPPAITSAGRLSVKSPSTVSVGSQDFMTPRRFSAPAIPVDFQGLMSPLPSRPLALVPNPQVAKEDRPEALAAAATPSPTAHDMNIDDLDLGDDSLDEALGLAKKVSEDDDAMEPLPLELDLDDDNLDRIADYLGPSAWNDALLPPDDVVLPPPADVSLFPAAPSPPARGSNDGPASVTNPYSAPPPLPPLGLGQPLRSEAPGGGGTAEPFEVVRPEPAFYLDVTSFLESSPDYNDPNEYVAGEDGMSRTGLEPGALRRARIRGLVQEHLRACWWREEMAVDASDQLVAGSLDGNVSFKKSMLERLIALTAAMLVLDYWHVPRGVGMPAIAEADASATLTRQRCIDEDDILHIGQLLCGLWKRLFRSLERDGLILLEKNGDNDSSAKRMERYEAIKQMVTRLDEICHQGGSIGFSPRASMYAQV